MQRITRYLGQFEEGSQPDVYPVQDFTQMIMHAANMGVPLTSREVRFVHQQFDAARERYLGYPAHTFNVFTDGAPNGEVPYEPWGNGVFINDVGLLLGTCASQWRNPASRPVLDCDLVRTRGP